MAIWKRLKKSTPEQEAEFRERMETVPFVDKLIMMGTALVTIVLPCLLVLLLIVLLPAWLFGLL